MRAVDQHLGAWALVGAVALIGGLVQIGLARRGLIWSGFGVMGGSACIQRWLDQS
jgi:hypothetical protein